MSNSTASVYSTPPNIPAKNEAAAIRRRGYMDAREGVGYPKEYEASWNRARQINYERGRHQCAIARAALGRIPPRWKLTERLVDVYEAHVPGGRALLRQTLTTIVPYADRAVP